MKIATILGTRPEIIKLSPLIPLLEKNVEHILIHTGQHYDYDLDSIFFQELDLPQPKYNFHIGSDHQGKQTGRMIEKIEQVLLDEKPDLVIIQGDTNTVLAGAIAASKLHIKIAHIEAGCRSFNRAMPEEINRIVADHVSDYLFAADEQSKKNLVQEGLPAEKIRVVGNTAYDACQRNIQFLSSSTFLSDLNLTPHQFVLSTIHRAENTNNKEILQNIISALNQLAEKIDVVFPIHPRTEKKLGEFGIKLHPKIKVTKPLGYIDFLNALSSCRFCISDSGGIQDEAVALDIPCLIPRNDTEWPQLVEAGKNLLVGNQTLSIVSKALTLIESESELQRIKQIKISLPSNVAQKIMEILKHEL